MALFNHLFNFEYIFNFSQFKIPVFMTGYYKFKKKKKWIWYPVKIDDGLKF